MNLKKINNTDIVKWNPLKLKGSVLMYLEGLHDDYEGFRLVLKGEKEEDKCVKLLFESNLGYRNLDESQRLKTLNENPILTEKWSFYKTNKSLFLDWFKNESYNVYDSKEITHYIITTPNDIIDIISDEEPIVEM